MRSRVPMLLPGEGTALLSVVGFLFASGGAFKLLAIAAVVVAKGAGWSVADDVQLRLLPILVNALFGAGYLWTGVLLYRGQRLGGYIAVTLLTLSLLIAAFSASPPGWGDLVMPVSSLLAVLAAWGHLVPGGRDREPHTSISPSRGG